MDAPAQTRPRSRMLPSTKIAIGFVVVIVLGFLWTRYSSMLFMPSGPVSSVEPGRYNLLGVSTAGYKIVVANRVAQLRVVESDDPEFKPLDNRDERTPEDMSSAKRVPIREMLDSLRGNSEALGRFIMRMNDIGEADVASQQVVWDAEDVRNALSGDAAAANRLQQDIGVDFDGMPLSQVRDTALLNGITVRVPVTVVVPVQGEEKKLTGNIYRPYQSRFGKAVEESLAGKVVDDPKAALMGTATMEAAKLVEDPQLREDVRAVLTSLADPKNVAQYANAAEHVLRSTTVIVNESHIQSVRSVENKTPDGKSLYTLILTLNDEGRRRLWQYSRTNQGEQLLVVKDGIAIAAPRIGHQLSQNEIQVTQLPDKTLVDEYLRDFESLRSK